MEPSMIENMIEDIEMKSSCLEPKNSRKIKKKIVKALCVLTEERLKHRFPKAVDRKDDIKKYFMSFDIYVPERITNDLDDVITRVYADAFQIKREAQDLGVYLDGHGDSDREVIQDLIDKKVSDVKKILGSDQVVHTGIIPF